MEGDAGPLHPLLPEPVEKLPSQVEPRGGGGHRPRHPGVDRLVALPVAAVGRSPAGDIGRQGHLPPLFEKGHQRLLSPVLPRKALLRLVVADPVENAPPIEEIEAGLPFQPLPQKVHRAMCSALKGSENQDLDRPSPGGSGPGSRRNDPGVVGHQKISGGEEGGKVRDGGGEEGGAFAVGPPGNHRQAALLPPGGRNEADLLLGQFVVVVPGLRGGSVHGLPPKKGQEKGEDDREHQGEKKPRDQGKGEDHAGLFNDDVPGKVAEAGEKTPASQAFGQGQDPRQDKKKDSGQGQDPDHGARRPRASGRGPGGRH